NDSPFQQEIFWLKMDGSGQVQRLLHHHSIVGSCGSNKDYWAAPHPVPSWDGSRILLASIWGGAACSRDGAYIIQARYGSSTTTGRGGRHLWSLPLPFDRFFVGL